jgi:hypothetical protein
MAAAIALYPRLHSSEDGNAPEVPSQVVEGCWDDGAGVRAKTIT